MDTLKVAKRDTQGPHPTAETPTQPVPKPHPPIRLGASKSHPQHTRPGDTLLACFATGVTAGDF